MSTLFCTKGLATSILALPLAVLSFAGFSPAAHAQAAPQLLPYTAKLIAGGATTNPASGTTCPLSGNISTDAFGDGCLATEVNLGSSTTGGPKFAVADKNGNIFFGDFVNGLVRRVDAITSVITTVAGGATSSPGIGSICGSGVSTSADGDGCPANLVKLSKPAALVFAPNGDLYFSDNGFDNVRKIAAVAGLITPTSIITHIVGGSTFGYNVNNTSTTGPVNAATQGLLNFPYGLALDAAGNNLYIADEGNNAVEVVNLTAATETIQGMSVPAGTIAKFGGYGNLNTKVTTGDCPDFTAAATGSRGGCYFGKWTDGALANVSNNDGVYSIAVDASNNVYFGNEFNNDVGFITSANVISNFAGIQGTAAKDLTKRGAAASFGIGSVFGIALDPANNLYVTDASSGAIWRVDGSSKTMYSIAGISATGTVCAAATDANGDGCPGTQAAFGHSGAGNFASTALPGPGIYGVSVDAYADLFFGDTELMVVRELASGTQFGAVGANQPTQTVDIHFDVSDGPAASGAYSLTAGSTVFALGTATCTVNSDNTTDCLLPVQATPSTLGAFTGTLTVKSKLGKTSNFTLNGNYVTSRFTRTTISASTGSACASTTISTTAPVTLTATVISTGTPTGTITFFANGTQIGTPQAVGSNGTATLTNTFSTAGTYTITAKYSGDTNFNASTSSGTTITTSAPTFTTALLPTMQSTVAAGQTGLYSFTVAQNVYAGTISFACTGLPAYSSCVFSPPTLTATGCSTTSTVALSILTQQATSANPAGLGIVGNGRWTAFGVLPGILLALFVGIRRRRSPLRFGQVWMALALLMTASGLMACGKSGNITAATPSGTYTITVQATGSAGTITSFTVPLTVK